MKLICPAREHLAMMPAPRSGPPWRLACFDLDGTLVRHTSSGQHLAHKLGHAAEMARIEQQYARGLASNAEVAMLDGAHYRGYRPEQVQALLADIPTIGQIAEAVAWLAGQGIASLLCTLAWRVVAEAFARRYGFLAWSGPQLELDAQGAYTGQVLAHFEANDKPAFVQAYCDRHGIAMQDVFHIGDSCSDLPLFRAVGFSVALNGDPLARSVASVSVDSESLLDALDVVPGLRAAGMTIAGNCDRTPACPRS